MLSDEEKEAIEVLQYVKNKSPFIFWYEDKPYNRKETINTILNLIEKQQKEIEELKEERLTLFDTTVKNSIKINDKKWKDKIKAKIEDLKENSNGDDFNLTNVIMLFKSLLEKE